MGLTDVRIDSYLSKCPGFSIPILSHFRAVVHEACPEVVETLKWSMPYFEYKRYNLCSMAAFKQHCAFGFWLASKMQDPCHLLAIGDEKTAMGNLGKVTNIGDLPSDTQLKDLIHDAMGLIDKGVKLTKAEGTVDIEELIIPDDLAKMLEGNPDAKRRFNEFSKSSKKEYVEWIVEAKTEATRTNRKEKAIELIFEGKTRYWKYTK